jgi:hypothetical protein
MHDKRLPHQTVFPKTGDPRKTVCPNMAGAGSLRTMMPPRPWFAQGGG